MKLLTITAVMAFVFSGFAFGHTQNWPETGVRQKESSAVDTLRRQISKAWNVKAFWQDRITVAEFEKEAIDAKQKVAAMIKTQPTGAVENSKYADFTELLSRKAFVQRQDNPSTVPQSFYKILDLLNINDPLLAKLGSPEIANFVNAYISMTCYRTGKAQPTFFEESKYVLNNLKDEKVKSAYLAPKVFTYNRFNMIDSTMKDLIKDINRLSKDEGFKKTVNENDNFYSAVTAGKTVSDFQLPDRNGKIIKLSDYKGKAVIIDVWATWCTACVANLPYFEAIADEFKERSDVVFINIGWENDGDKAKWLKFLTDRKLHGIQLIAERAERNGIDQQDGLKDKLRLTGIPRYIFIDKQGKIVDSFGPYPSKPGFKELVLKTIAK